MTLHFPDVSHWNAPLSLRGAVAVIAKATEGASGRDPIYSNYKAQAAAMHITFAGYHWVNNEPIGTQAANAYAVIGKTPTMWDCEAIGATVPRILALTQQFRALGGNPTLCYLPHWWWKDHLGSPDLRPIAQAGLKLISSGYPSTGYSDRGVGWVPYGGVAPTIWQYTNGLVGQPPLFNGKRVDFNAFKGTQAQLIAVIKGGSVTNPIPVDSTAHSVMTGRWKEQAWIPGTDQPLAAMILSIQSQMKALALAVAAISNKLGSLPSTPSDAVSDVELATALRAAADELSPPTG